MKKPIISLSKDETVFGQVEDFLASKSTFLDQFHLKNLIYPLIFLIVILLIKKLLDWFLSTEVGLALRVTGDNPKMARIMAVNTGKMILVGLGIANGLVAFSGALFAQIQKFADVNLGIGMIIVGLASVFIGEALENSIGRSSKLINATTAVILGSVIYKLAIALAYEVGLSPDYFNLITAVIVTVALSIPSIRADMLSIIRSNGK
jgi:putative ABC transport system permease protein